MTLIDTNADGAIDTVITTTTESIDVDGDGIADVIETTRIIEAEVDGTLEVIDTSETETIVLGGTAPTSHDEGPSQT